MNIHDVTTADALQQLKSATSGITDAEAAVRLERYGANSLRVAKPVSGWKILARQLTSVVVGLLAIAAAASLVIGETIEGIAIVAVLLINTLVGFLTELRARRAMEALLQLDTPRAVVIREGHAKDIDARHLVPGDVIRLEEGQTVPADARILEARDLRTDEATLTGESLPVSKSTDPVASDTPLADRVNMLYKGTTVVGGTARALVANTGMSTEIGRIGGLVDSIPDERTSLEKRLDSLGRRLVWVALAAGVVVGIVGLLQGMALSSMLEMAVALAISAVPEGLPAVATIALAVGVRRMARRKALVRRLPSVETLGSVSVIGADKTGTLTAGEMTVTILALGDREIAISGSGYRPEGEFTENGSVIDPLSDATVRDALRIAILANSAEVEREGDSWLVRGDPTDGALLVAARKAGLDRANLQSEQPLVRKIPFSSALMLMASFHRERDEGDSLVAYVKGAPGRLLEISTTILEGSMEVPLDDSWRSEVLRRNEALAGNGLRVIALALGRTSDASREGLRDLTFVGLAGLIDPAAHGVKDTIARFRAAGIRTVMITGDQARTAQAIAADLGILRDGDTVLDGKALEKMSAEDLANDVEGVAVFSRVSPENKLSIIDAYQRRGAIVAMLGDGVNDAAALKKADVGVAMGVRGADIAREAAAVVLQDDRFSTIAVAVEEGRVIFDNIRKVVFYLFSCNLAEVLVLLIAGFAGAPLPLLPLQLLWLNIVTDTFPALALAVEGAEEGVMRRPPRDPEDALLSRRFLQSITVYALMITAVTLAAFVIGGAGSATGGHRAVTMSFATLGIAQGLHLGNARRRSAVLDPSGATANRWAIAAVIVVLLLQVTAVQFPPLAQVLHTQSLTGRDWLIVVGLSLIPAAAGQLWKRFRPS